MSTSSKSLNMSCNQWLWKDPLGGLQVPYASFKCAPCRVPDELHSCRLRLAARGALNRSLTPWSSRGRHRELVGMAASKLRSASWRGASRRRPNTIVLARSSSWSPYDLAGRRLERSQIPAPGRWLHVEIVGTTGEATAVILEAML